MIGRLKSFKKLDAYGPKVYWQDVLATDYVCETYVQSGPSEITLAVCYRAHVKREKRHGPRRWAHVWWERDQRAKAIDYLETIIEKQKTK